MGGSHSSSFDDAAQKASDRIFAETGDNFKATEAATAVYAQKAMYESGRDGAIPNNSTVGGNVFDAAATAVGMYVNSDQRK